MFTLAISCFDHFQFTLFHGPNIPGSYAILFFTELDFTFTTRQIYTWALFSLWLNLFIPPGAVFPLFSSSILDTYWHGRFTFEVISFCLFILFMGFSRRECWSGFPFPSPVDHILSELSTMTPPSWTLHGISHSFIEWESCDPCDQFV